MTAVTNLRPFQNPSFAVAIGLLLSGSTAALYRTGRKKAIPQVAAALTLLHEMNGNSEEERREGKHVSEVES